MTDLDAPLHVTSQSQDSSTSLADSVASEAVFHSDSQDSLHQPLTLRAGAELRALLQALPTRTDIEALIGRLEAIHRK